MGLEAEGEVDARALALGALERGAGAAAERAHGVGLAGAAHVHHALGQGPVEVPAQHLGLQRAAGGTAVALGESPMGRGAGPRDGHGRRFGLGLLSPAAAASAPAHGIGGDRRFRPTFDRPSALGFVILLYVESVLDLD